MLGFDLKAQLLPPQQYAAVVELFRAAGQEGGVTLGDPPPDAAPPGQLVPGARMAVEVRLLGQVAVAERQFASLNPNAIMRSPITIDDYLDAPYITEPLRLRELPVDEID